MPADGTRAAVQIRRGLRHVRALQQAWTRYTAPCDQERAESQMTTGIPESFSARPELENSQDPKRTGTVQDFFSKPHFSSRQSLM
jgi:hypothetical protein